MEMEQKKQGNKIKDGAFRKMSNEIRQKTNPKFSKPKQTHNFNMWNVRVPLGKEKKILTC